MHVGFEFLVVWTVSKYVFPGQQSGPYSDAFEPDHRDVAEGEHGQIQTDGKTARVAKEDVLPLEAPPPNRAVADYNEDCLFSFLPADGLHDFLIEKLVRIGEAVAQFLPAHRDVNAHVFDAFFRLPEGLQLLQTLFHDVVVHYEHVR